MREEYLTVMSDSAPFPCLRETTKYTEYTERIDQDDVA